MATFLVPAALGGTPAALHAVLLGGAAVAAVVAIGSACRGAVAQVQDGPAVIYGAMAASLVAELGPQVPAERAVMLVLAGANVAALLTGVVLWALGRARAGSVVRYTPFPVIGGFLAGSGLLLVQTAMGVLTAGDRDHLTEPLQIGRAHV